MPWSLMTRGLDPVEWFQQEAAFMASILLREAPQIIILTTAARLHHSDNELSPSQTWCPAPMEGWAHLKK